MDFHRVMHPKEAYGMANSVEAYGMANSVEAYGMANNVHCLLRPICPKT